jgi:membrane protein required for colicin V production
VNPLNLLDIILLVILAATSVLGIVKGLVRQVFGLLSVILGLVFALGFYSHVSWLYLRFISSEVLAQFLGFLTVFLAVVCAGWISSHLLSKLIKGPLKLLNNVLGGCLGFLTGILVCSVVIFALSVFPISKKALKDSQLSPVCMKITKTMIGLIPKDLKEKFKDAYQDISKKVEKDAKKI